METHLTSDQLLPLYRDMAIGGDQFLGLNILQHSASITKLARAVDAVTLLDFGCGAGDQYRSPYKMHHSMGIKRKDVTLYDPSFAHHHLPHGKFDLVVSSDVLEHIPEADIPLLIERLFGYARKAVWMSVCCRPAKKCFPGTDLNLHVTQRPFEWWRSIIDPVAHMHGVLHILVETP